MALNDEVERSAAARVNFAPYPSRDRSLDSHQLHTTRSATFDGHCGFTALEVIRDECDELLIGFAIDWSCSEPGEPHATFRLLKRTDA